MTTVDAERQFDADLIGRIGTGDEEAFAELYDRFSPGLFSMVMKMTGDEAETEDVLQDAFSHIWRKAARYGAPDCGGSIRCGPPSLRFLRDNSKISALAARPKSEDANSIPLFEFRLQILPLEDVPTNCGAPSDCQE